MEAVRSLAAGKAVSPSQIVYAWMLSRDPKPFPIVTASKTEHLAENLKSADVVLSDEELKRLDRPWE